VLFVSEPLECGLIVLGPKGKDNFLLARIASEDVGRDVPANVIGAETGVPLKTGEKHWHDS
jgi:hypothetical protein